jgi:colanic acid/amylovoran biosynthesis glycosyltransferase
MPLGKVLGQEAGLGQAMGPAVASTGPRSGGEAPALGVVHSMRSWLPQSQAWLHHQLEALPGTVRWPVACEGTENLDQFPAGRLHVQPRPQMPVRVLRRRSPRMRLWGWTRWLAGVVRREEARVLHSHFGNQAWQDLGAVRPGTVHVASFYGYDATLLPRREPVWRARYEQLFAQVDAVLAEGPAMGRTLEGLGCPRDKLRIHHLGVDPSTVRFERRARGDDGPLRVLMAGRYVEKKGFPDGLAALGLLARAGRDVSVTLVGGPDDSRRSHEETARIAAAIEGHGLAARVRQPGLVPYARLMAMAYDHDVLLCPSRLSSDGDSEGGAPVTLVEMAATGLPIVATRHADIPHVLPASAAPMLAGEGDAQGLADALGWMMDHGDEVRRIADDARRHVEAEFDSRRQGARLARLYETLADGGGPAAKSP